MTDLSSGRLHLTCVDTQDTVRIELRGDLDHHGGDVLLDAVSRALADQPRLKELHLHCAGLATIDSSGLSALLMVRRHTAAAGVRLHLDDRPARLERMLQVTGTLGHFTVPDAGNRQAGSRTAERQSAAPEESIPARSGSTDTRT
ncbi:STAS domain-containing protein [Streptomyces sp. cmx-4-9]|uniref:STAS domain-containing protein n=1 Tax=Streptomyces sp. cmx-4-9 TaxID=2790941 RepID=UPI003980D8CD